MAALLKRLSALLRSRKAQLALAVRVTVAAFGALAAAMALHLLLPLWAVLTALIVTQMSVGRSLKATRDYMLGTIGGAIYGGAIAVLIPHSGEGAAARFAGAGGGAVGLYRGHQSQPERGHGHRCHRAAGADDEPRQCRWIPLLIACSR